MIGGAVARRVRQTSCELLQSHTEPARFLRTWLAARAAIRRCRVVGGRESLAADWDGRTNCSRSQVTKKRCPARLIGTSAIQYLQGNSPCLMGTREGAMTDVVNNGVNVEALISAREALTKAPEGAKFKWRAACEWKNGTHSHSTVE